MADDATTDLNDAPPDDYDSPWKEAVVHAFPEFLTFYFPSAAAEIDWSRGYDFLDQELAIDLFAVLDWMMGLPNDLQRELWQKLSQLERTRQMPYITSVERIGIEKGIQQGIQQGVAKGVGQGEAKLLRLLIQQRFGPLSDETEARLAQAAPEQLEAWALQVLTATTLDDIFALNEDN